MRVVIAEDQALLREGLGRLFADGGHEVVGSYGDAVGLPAAVASLSPDLVVLDVRMPPTHTNEGTVAAARIRAEHPDIGVLVLSQHIETRHVVALMTRGGFGYLLKDRVFHVQEFLSAAQRVADGGSALDPEVVAALLAPTGGDDALAELTAREREVLEHMAQGLTNSGIAKRLVLADRTVETHVRSVLMKLGITVGEDGHRRVLAVLAYLHAGEPHAAPHESC